MQAAPAPRRGPRAECRRAAGGLGRDPSGGGARLRQTTRSRV